MELLTDARQALHQVVEPDQPNVAVVRPNLALILHLQNEDDVGTVSEGGTIKFFPPTCRNKFMCGGTGEKRGEKRFASGGGGEFEEWPWITYPHARG